MGRKILSIVLVLAMLTLCGCDQLAGAKTSLNNFIKTIDGEPLEEEMGGDTIKIGVLEPQSGKYVNDAAEELKGIKLANKMFPTVLDKKVELVYADSQSDPKTCCRLRTSFNRCRLQNYSWKLQQRFNNGSMRYLRRK